MLIVFIRKDLKLKKIQIEVYGQTRFKLYRNLPKPISSSDPSSDSSFFSSFFSAAGAAAAAAAGAAAPAAGAAPTPEPMLVISSLTLTPSNALANKPGQYGSTSTLAAFKMVEIFSPFKIEVMF